MSGLEKLVYVLWDADGDRLRAGAGRLAAAGARGVQVNLVDDDVAAASRWRIESCPPLPDAFVSLWLPTAHADTRDPIDTLVRESAGGDARLALHLVAESCPLPNTRFPTAPGERTPGFAQMALLRRPADLPAAEFLATWLDDHTDVAIATQDTFVYVQDVVVRTLVGHGEPIDGIVEECFPAAAMTDIQAFFDAVGDDGRLADHTSRMIASTSRFLDLSRIDVIPTSRYVFGGGA